MGRHKKPLELHVFEGTFSADAHTGNVVLANGAKFRRPARLSKDQSYMWSLVTTNCEAWLGTSDEAQLLALCEAWELRCKSARLALADPLDRHNRACYVAYSTEFDRLAARFGLTPSDRAGMVATALQEQDELKQYMG